jgi:hypothetical protein
MNRAAVTLATAVLAATLSACIRAKHPALRPNAPAAPVASFWQEPRDIANKDLYFGPWGAAHAPDPDAVYTFVEKKHTGVNLGMTVVDPKGRTWSVKQTYPGGIDPEGPVEVALSRLLSAVGYHQPHVYYLPSFQLKDDWGVHTERGGRFRLKNGTLKETTPWSWAENPFVGTRPYQGLLVLMMMFNSTDLKDTNNSIYESRAGDFVEQRYVVRDLGASLGDTNRLAPFKGDPDAFEREPFLIGVSGPYVEFAYRGWYRNFVRDRITPAEVRWASNLLGQLSERQLQDAFRAGGFEPDVANRFIRRLRQKITQGRGLAAAE